MILKDMTRRMSVLHEAQVLQLKWYPMVIFQNATSVELTVDIEGKEIHFFVKTKQADLKDKKLCEQLDKYVKWLLGDDWFIRVKDHKGKQSWKSHPAIKYE